MKTISRIFFYIVLAAALLFWTVFTIYNAEPLSLFFLNWESMALPLAVWLLVAFTTGGICGLLLCASGYFKGRAAQKGLQLELDRRDIESQQASRPSGVESRSPRPMSVADTPSSPDSVG
ncbi:MAG: LapA family protein [Gammaproteobacteria bacterium]|nr:LapA family protein [Gammaproteobacteria bacterium]